MSSAPSKNVISPDQYGRTCWENYSAHWRWHCENDDSVFKIVINVTPTVATTAAFLINWKAMMRKVESERKVDLKLYDYRESSGYKKRLKDRFIPLFCDAIKRNIVITSLKVSSEVFNNIMLKSLFKVLQTHTTITNVQFWRMNHSIGSYLEQLIVVNSTLKSLSVDITCEEAKCVARALPHNSAITSLRLWGSLSRRLGNKGLRILCEGLKRNHSITDINLGYNDIDAEGAKNLCSLFAVNHSITSVDLRWNKITRLPQDYAFLSHITTLKIYGNRYLFFPPKHLSRSQHALSAFFGNFRYGQMKFHFLLGFHERVGNHTSIQSYLYHSTIFEPALLSCIFEFLS